MAEIAEPNSTRVNSLQSMYDRCIDSPCKVSSVVLGIIFIIAGAVAAGALHSQLGNISLSCLVGIPIGIVLIILGVWPATSIANNDEPEKASTPSETTLETGQKSFLPCDRIKLVNHTDLDAAIYTLNRSEGDREAVLIGRMNQEERFGPTAPTILCFAAEEKNENPHHKTMAYAINTLGFPSTARLYRGVGEILKLQFTYDRYRVTVTWNVFYLIGAGEDESGQKFAILQNPGIENYL